MKIVETFPRPVREIENCWVPMADGARLAARIWLPEDAEVAPVPVILEYIPYRKRDFTRFRDEPMHHYFAGHGYAAIRLDARGSGDSDGVLHGEYLQQELDDGAEAIAWFAAQPWCDGAVGMMGKSWGGFNALQVAALRPPALKAIITVCSTDDRYADDVHFMGGCVLNDHNWAPNFFALNARPPDPALFGDGWRETWLARLDNATLFQEVWLGHQRRDEFWKHGSVCEDFSRIACAVYATGGWADGYSNAVFRLLAGLNVPRRGLVGPWAHLYGHDGVPGPAIGFLQDALRWWDRWLKDIDTGVMDEPMLRAWMQHSPAPTSYDGDQPGRWVAEEGWPSPSIEAQTFVLNPGRLDDQPRPEARLDVCSPQTTGLAGGDWDRSGKPGTPPGDQREDDGKSLTFDSGPLNEALEILGAPVVTLDLAADRPVAMVAVRLNDVAPDGSSTRVSYGVLNLTHRDSHADPEPLEPGQRYRVWVQLNDAAHSFAAGHRIRIAVSSAYWPIVWPMPEAVTLSLFTGASTVSLPVRALRAGDDALAPFEAPETAPDMAKTVLTQGYDHRTIERDAITGETTYAMVFNVAEDGAPGISRIDATGLEFGTGIVKRCIIDDHDPTSARTEVARTIHMGRDDWRTRVVARSIMSATRDAFRLEASLDAYEGETRVFSRTWDVTIPRDLV